MTKIGRPRNAVHESEIEALRASGASWRAIAKKMGGGGGTVHRIGQRRSKNVCGPFPHGRGCFVFPERTANVIVISSHAEISPAMHCASQLACVNRKTSEMSRSSNAPAQPLIVAPAFLAARSLEVVAA